MSFITRTTSAVALVTVLGLGAPALAQGEPAACLSMDPTMWPEAAKPYFLVLADTSGSMTACTTPPTAPPQECNQSAPGYSLNACGMVPSRLNDQKCALRRAVQAFGGSLRFGLATSARLLISCPAGTCASSCGAPTGGTCTEDVYGCSVVNFASDTTGCGNYPNCSGQAPPPPNLAAGTWRNGANLVVGIPQQPWWLGPSAQPDNTAELLAYFDDQCGDGRELFASGGSAIAGRLRSSAQYLRAGWNPWTPTDYCAPLSYLHPTPASGLDRACRGFNVLLIIDDDEGCDAHADAVAAAADLYDNGVTVGGVHWPVRTWVINFAGATASMADQIAAAGGTGSSFFGTNEAQLSQVLAGILSRFDAREVCDNTDNNCNGCTDEGFLHYCNTGNFACCGWATQAQRTACLSSFTASITAQNPKGNTALLPCTTVAQAANPATWLCHDPLDRCDDVDNNCQNGVDENQLKCGNPPRCPVPEVCNGQDDNCNGVIDEGNVCGGCVVRPEVCDGCDNDCDGIADNLVATFPCGPAGGPANCLGVLNCKPPQPVAPGGCVAGGGFAACSNSPGLEVCDGQDNDCNGIVDDILAFAPCEPAGTPPGLVYGGTSRCQRGVAYGCGPCTGFVGPQPELCNGIDDDCDGMVDEGVVDSQGNVTGDACCAFGARCGTGRCTAGAYACSGGRLACVGGVGPLDETCNGEDDDCNGIVDDVPGLGKLCTTGLGDPGRQRCDVDAGTLFCEALSCPAPDAGSPDAGVPDAGQPDAGAPDAGQPDAGPPDAGQPDAGEPDGGASTSDAGDPDPVPGPGCGCGQTEGGAATLFLLLTGVVLLGRRRVRAGKVLAASVLVLVLGACDGSSSSGPSFASARQSLDGGLDCLDAGCGDLASDPENCGACGAACALPNAVPRCIDGVCAIERCESGYADVNGLVSDGCEVACPGADGGPETCNGLDDDCNGVVDDGFNLVADPANCGACGNVCGAGSPNAIYGCDAGACQFLGCAAGWHNVGGGLGCDYACTFRSADEDCNGIDDNCDGQIDENVAPRSPVEVCGVSPAASRPECTSQVQVTCQGGAWACAFPAGVCFPTCAAADDVCDALDNNCDGQLNENVPRFGEPCASDDGLPPPGHGPCRTTGTMVCNGPANVVCSAVKADCNTLPGGCTELCDGIDNDCDGLIDEPFTNKGPNAQHFVRPEVTRIDTSTWVYSYEASRPGATSAGSGVGNGYFCLGTACPPGVPSAPAGVQLEATVACSRPGVLPWHGVTGPEADQACAARGGRLCTTVEWQTACSTSPASSTNCQWGYGPRGTACTSSSTATKYCNLAAFDFAPGTPGVQDGLLVTGSAALQNCYADWSGLLFNTASSSRVYDMTGNLRELTRSTPGVHRLMGGSYLSTSEDGARCSADAFAADATYQSAQAGFRCCFGANPSQ